MLLMVISRSRAVVRDNKLSSLSGGGTTGAPSKPGIKETGRWKGKQTH